MILLGNSEEVLKTLPDNSVDSIVTDPPYGLSFMGKKWDYDVPSTELWAECLRVLKPGGYLLAFAGTRTQHRMAVRIEDAGFEIRDMIAWVYGSGFPKSLNISKTLDKMVSSSLEVSSKKTDNADELNEQRKSSQSWDNNEYGGGNAKCPICNKWFISGSPCTCPKEKKEYKTDEAKKWEGWGTALKPALEPITVARKPISEKNIAENVLKWGTGGINIDGCRVGTELIEQGREGRQVADSTSYHNGLQPTNKTTATGRFPANLIHDGSDEVVGLFPNTKSGKMTSEHKRHTDGSPNGIYGRFDENHPLAETYGDQGSAARFFYCAKASKSERNKGLEGFEVVEVRGGGGRVADGYDESTQHLKEAARKYGAVKTAKQNIHPTVKPVALMRYLVKMVTPVGGTVLDPFNGSGTTGIAAKLENFDYIGIEREEEYVKISEARIAAWQEPQGALL